MKSFHCSYTCRAQKKEYFAVIIFYHGDEKKKREKDNTKGFYFLVSLCLKIIIRL